MTTLIGHILREAREAKGWSLEEAERLTRIRAKYLAALEADNFLALPAETQARGFLRNYAQALGLNTEQVMTFYAAQRKKSEVPFPSAAPASTPAARPTANVPTTPGRVTSRFPRWLSSDVLIGVVLTILLVLLLSWGIFQWAEGNFSPTPTRTPTSVLAALQTPLATTTPRRPEPPPTALVMPETPLAAYSGVHVLVRAEQRIWLRVTADGTEIFASQLRPGESQEFVGQNRVEITTGNGRGTRVIWNGRDQGVLGEVGQIVTRIWTISGMSEPTPAATPTGLATATPTHTPSP